MKPKLFLTIGEMEAAEDSNNDFSNFGQILPEKNIVQLRVKIYKGQQHMGTAVPSFEDGVEFVLGD